MVFSFTILCESTGAATGDPTVGHLLAYGMDMQRVEYRLDNGNLTMLQEYLPKILYSLWVLHESGEVQLSDDDEPDPFQ